MMIGVLLLVGVVLVLAVLLVLERRGKQRRPSGVRADEGAGGRADEEAFLQRTRAHEGWPAVAQIEFEVEALPEDVEIFPDGVSPWVHLEDPEPDIARMRQRDEIVIRSDKVVVIIDYPLERAVLMELTSADPRGFSRAEVARSIAREYRRIYVEEEATATQKTLPMEQRGGVVNRNRTDGKYGIWGHDLGDLDLLSIDVHQAPDGTLHLALNVDS